MNLEITNIPKGFQLSHTPEGFPLLSYHTSGMTGVKIFFLIWLTGWTCACVFMTQDALLAPLGIKIGLLIFSIPFWAAEFFTIGYVIWYFCSKIQFEFRADIIRVSRTLGRYRKSRDVTKMFIAKVRQVKDGGEDDSFPSWGIVIDEQKPYKVLSHQQMEQSSWLGQTIASWSCKEFIPWRDERKEMETI